MDRNQGGEVPKGMKEARVLLRMEVPENWSDEVVSGFLKEHLSMSLGMAERLRDVTVEVDEVSGLRLEKPC